MFGNEKSEYRGRVYEVGETIVVDIYKGCFPVIIDTVNEIPCLTIKLEMNELELFEKAIIHWHKLEAQYSKEAVKERMKNAQLLRERYYSFIGKNDSSIEC